MSSIFIRTIIIYVILALLLKLMGKRQIGELEVNELVSTLLISEIAAIPISDTSIPLFAAAIPIIFIVTLEILTSALKNKWNALKRAVEGEPTYIIYKGRLRQDELIKNRISINELLTEMRIQGIGSIGSVYYGILEQNGKLSLLTGEKESRLAHSLIIDGAIEQSTLTSLGLNNAWLDKTLMQYNLPLSDVLLLTVDDNGTTELIRKERSE